MNMMDEMMGGMLDMDSDEDENVDELDDVINRIALQAQPKKQRQQMQYKPQTY